MNRPGFLATFVSGEEASHHPEQLFAVGYAACFEGALGVVARRERLKAGDASIDSRVSLLPTEERRFYTGLMVAL